MATVIGKVALKVIPDTSNFRKETEAEVKRAVEDIDAQVPLNADSDHLTEEVKDAVRRAQAEAGDIDVELNVDDDPLRNLDRIISDARKKLADSLDAKVNVSLDNLDEMAEKLRSMSENANVHLEVDNAEETRAKIAEIARGAVAHIDVDVDDWAITRFRKNLESKFDHLKQTIKMKVSPDVDAATFEKALSRLGEGNHRVHIEAEVDRDRIRQSLADTFKALPAKLTKLTLGLDTGGWGTAIRKSLSNIKVPDIDFSGISKGADGALQSITRLGGQRLHWLLIKDVETLVKDFDLLSAKAAQVGTAVAGLGAHIGSASGLVAGLAGNIYQLGAGMVVLPGLMAGMAASTAAMTIALKETSKRVPELVTAFKAMSASGVNAFWAQAEAPMKRIATQLIPQMTSGWNQLNTALGRFTGRFADSVTKIVGPALPAFFSGLSKGIDNAGGFAANLSRMMADSMRLAGQFMPAIGTWLSNLTKGWADYFDAAMKSGQAFKWVDGARQVLNALGSTFMSLISIIGGIGKAGLEAGYGITGVASALKDVAAVVNGANFQASLVGVFKASAEAMSNIYTQVGPALGRFFTALAGTAQKVFPEMGKAIGLVGKTLLDSLANPTTQAGIQSFFGSISKALETLAPSLRNVGPAFGIILEIMGNFIKNVAPVIGQAFDTMVGPLKSLVGPLDRASKSLAGGFLAAINAVQPAIKRMIPAIGEIIDNVGPKIGKALEDSAPKIKEFADKMADLVDALAKFSETDFGSKVMSFGAMGLAIGGAAAKIAPFAKAIMSLLSPLNSLIRLIPGVNGPFSLLGKTLEWLPRIIGGVVEVLGGPLTLALTALAGGFAYAYEKIEWVSKVFGKLGESWKKVFTDFSARNLGEAIGRTLAAIPQFLIAAFDGIAEWVASVGTMIVEKFKEIDWANLATNMWNGFIGGIKAAWSGIGDFFKGLASGFIDAFKEMLGIHSPSTVFAEIGGFIVQGLVQGLTNGIQSVIDIMGTIGTAIKTAFGDAVTWLTEQATAIGTTLSGIWTTISTDTSAKFTEIKGWITGAFTDAGTWIATKATEIGTTLSGAWTTISTSTSEKFGEVKNWITTNVGDAATWLGTKAAEMATSFATKAGEIASTASAKFGEAKTWITTHLTTAATTVADKAVSMATSFTAKAGEIATTASTKFGEVKTWITSHVTSAASAVAGKFQEIASTVASKATEVASNASSKFGEMKSAVTGFVTNAASDAKGKFQEIASSAASQFQAAKASGQSNMQAIATVVSQNIGSAARSIASGMGDMARQASSGFGSVAREATSGMRSFADDIRTGIGNALDHFRGFGDSAKWAIGNLGWTLWSAGYDLIGGLVNSIESGFDRVRGTLGRLTAMLPSWKGPYSLDKVLLAPNGQVIIEGFINGLESRYGKVERSLTDLTKQVASIDFELPSFDRSAGAGILDGMISQVEDGATTLHSLLNGIEKDMSSRNFEMAVSATSSSNARSAQSVLNAPSSTATGVTAGGVNVVQNITTSDPLQAARVASDQLLFAVGG